MEPAYHEHIRPDFQRFNFKELLSVKSHVSQKMDRKPAFSRVQVGNILTDETMNDETPRDKPNLIHNEAYNMNSPHNISDING